MKTEKKVVAEFKVIAKDYAYDEDIMCMDDERIRAIKKIIDQKLSLVDKTIILLYAELMSYRKLGELMHLSHMTIRKEVKRIIRIIKSELNNENLS